MHGSGILSWANGFRYEGELCEGKQHGYGTFTEASGERDGRWASIGTTAAACGFE